MNRFYLKKNRKPGRCAIRFCSNKAKGLMCSTCRSRKTRAADPVKYAFYNLRNHAKARGILFTITLDQFREWCHKVKYIGFSGRKAESYTIDRIHEDLGYHADNIQVLTRSDNVKKYFSYDWRTRTAVVTTETKSSSITNNPF